MGAASKPLVVDAGILLGGLALFAALTLLPSPQKSAAFDEQYHLAAGYAYLRTGDFRLATNHPPLMGMLAALALLPYGDIQLPLDHAAWQTGDRYRFSDVWLWESNTQGPRLIEQARIPIAIVGLILLAGIYGWTRRAVGRWGASVALILAALDPNLIANSRLITTDLGLRRLSVLWAIPVAFVLLGLTAFLTIGFRHLLPVMPFLLVAAGYVAHPARPDYARSRAAKLLVVGCVGWLIINAWRIYPHQESFFNELAGDWTHWSEILVDSNLDWGQDLPGLKRVMEEQGIESVNLAYFGNAVPERYGVRYRPLYSYLRQIEGIELNAYNPYTPEPGWYAISATSLRLGLLQPETADLYAYFRGLDPVARAGYSIYLYWVEYPAAMPVDRPVIVGVPLAALSPDAVGVQPGRRLQAKWSRDAEITIFPGGNGAEAAVASLPRLDANFGDVLTLLGYTADPPQAAPGATLHFDFFWQVGTAVLSMPAPTRGAPLSFFLHVTGADAADIVAQYDGWPVALRGLESGDIIRQPVTVTLGDDLEPGVYPLLAGLYLPQDGTRLAVVIPESAPDAPQDHLRLGEVEVVDP